MLAIAGLLVVSILIIVMTVTRAVNVQGQKLAAFDEFGIGGVVGLDDTKIPATSQDFIHRDDAGRFLILGEEVRGPWREAIGVMLGDQFQGSSGDLISPEPGDVRLVARVFLNDHVAA